MTFIAFTVTFILGMALGAYIVTQIDNHITK